MRPMLKPALIPMWRSDSTLQLGLDSRPRLGPRGLRRDRAGMVLGLLDGTRDVEPRSTATPSAAGADPGERGGPAPHPGPVLAARRRRPRRRAAAHPRHRGHGPRLSPELSALSLLQARSPARPRQHAHPPPVKAQAGGHRPTRPRRAASSSCSRRPACTSAEPSMPTSTELAPLHRGPPGARLRGARHRRRPRLRGLRRSWTTSRSPTWPSAVRELTGIVGPLVLPGADLLPALPGAAARRP